MIAELKAESSIISEIFLLTLKSWCGLTKTTENMEARMKNKKTVKNALEKLIRRYGSKAALSVVLRKSERYINMMLSGKVPSKNVYDDIQELLNNV